MLFNSYIFPVFFSVCFALYWLLRNRPSLQNHLLLAASYFFYGWWDHRFLVLLTLSNFIDYICGLEAAGKSISWKDRLKPYGFTLLISFALLSIDYSALSTGGSFSLGDLLHDEAQPHYFFLTLAAVCTIALIPWASVLKIPKEKSPKFYVAFSAVSNLSILAVFKYFNFFIDSLRSLANDSLGLDLNLDTLNIILPVGISFYTFQTMSYTIDIYRGKIQPTRSFWLLGTYVTFFPQLVAGPIERASHLLPQFQKKREWSVSLAKEGLWLIVWGLYKKIVIADNLAVVVNETFARAGQGEGGAYYLIGIYAFAFQIYGDFSGYSDIARGVSKLLGFDLMLNFRIPYASKSPSEFWTRWHISLSSWLRDYLYIPLGGNRGGSFATYRNLVLTMLLGGLWHGAAWTFVLWGAYQGLVLVGYRVFAPNIDKTKHSKLKSLALWFVMFQFTCIGWLIFRAPDIQTIFSFLSDILFDFHLTDNFFQNAKTFLFYSGFLILFQVIQHRSENLMPFKKWPSFLQINLLLFVLYSLFCLSSKGGQDFIYFAF